MFFAPSRPRIDEKRGRKFTARKAPSTSRISLLSGITALSGDSSGSGSTVTQESVSRARNGLRPSSNQKQTKRKAIPSTTRRRATSSSSNASSSSSVDVFAYLDRSGSRVSLSQPDPDSYDDTRYLHDLVPVFEESDRESTSRSLHSDSGIEIRDSSPEGHFRRMRPLIRLNPLQEEDIAKGSLPPVPDLSEEVPAYEQPYGGYRMPGQLSYDCEDIESAQSLGEEKGCAAFEDPERTAETPSTLLDSSDMISGYNGIAGALSEAGPRSVPRALYRKFSKLNHRILLELQDEISELEEQLEALDQVDDRMRHRADGTVVPESRRARWAYRGSELHARRIELIGRTQFKIEQYNRSLTSYRDLTGRTCRPDLRTVGAYRDWLLSRPQIIEEESRYLDHVNDLVVVCDTSSCTAPGGHWREPIPWNPWAIIAYFSPLIMVLLIFFVGWISTYSGPASSVPV